MPMEYGLDERLIIIINEMIDIAITDSLTQWSESVSLTESELRS